MLINNEIPWAWYVARSSGLVGFALLYVSIFLGLTIRIPFLRKIFLPAYSAKIHCWISFQALLFVLVHGVALLFDKFINFNLADVFLPFASEYQTNFVALGVIGFYLMIILVVTSYEMKFIPHKLWRMLHFANILLYVFVVIHAFFLGTDMKNPTVFNIFLWANAFLVFVVLTNIEIRIKDAYIQRKNASQIDQNNSTSI